jgi:hypothetical protein
MDGILAFLVEHAALLVFLALLGAAVFIVALVILVKNGYRLRVTWHDGGIHMDPPK